MFIKPLLACSMILNLFWMIIFFQYVLIGPKMSNVILQRNSYVWPYCQKFDQYDRLKNTDLSKYIEQVDHVQEENLEWNICNRRLPPQITKSNSNQSDVEPFYGDIKLCEFTATVEHKYQLSLFADLNRTYAKKFTDCVLLPPIDYRWPKKYVKFPAEAENTSIFWSNLGLNSYQNVSIFNPNYPKNVYHFHSPSYDIEQEAYLNMAAKYIPFGAKIRNMLDIGAGGGSLSIALSRRYDVNVINTIRPEFPYCEYISERGGLCIILNSLKPLPFAKFTFDVIHHSWVYHSSTPSEWRTVLLEQNRVLRPGGYLWITDGISQNQYSTIRYLLIEQLGYRVLLDETLPFRNPHNVSFGKNPYQLDFRAIYMKPTHLIKNHQTCL